MKFLEAKNKKSQPQEENKMQTGSRPDQQPPQHMSVQILAQQLGVDITQVEATGDHGEVLAKDVRAHAKKQRAANQANPPISSPNIPKGE